MATNPNLNEADSDDDYDQPGWFYHAPARRKHVDEEAAMYPPMSQIPGLTEGDQPEPDPVKPLFRETDTKYVRLAKQGGRANLLQMKENSADKRDAVGYPRNEWFYLEDNAIEDDAEKKKLEQDDYIFMRPEYMVFQPNQRENFSGHNRPARGPFGHDRLTVFEREQGSVTDKTVRLPELIKPGYGVRTGKPPKVLKGSQFVRNKPPSAHTDPGAGPRPQKYLGLPGHEEEKGNPKMKNILSYEYERKWHKELSDWQDTQDVGRVRHQQMTNVPPFEEKKAQSEYTVNFAKRSTAIHSASRQPEDVLSTRPSEGKSTTSSVKQNETQRLREAMLRKPTEKDMFKMTRFKNVPARITTHRPPVQQPAC